MLGILLTLTEQQGQTTEKILASLQTEIKALQVAVDSLHAGAASVAKSAAGVSLAAKNAAPGLQAAAGNAASTAVKESMEASCATAAGALDTACEPVLRRLSAVATAVAGAEHTLRRATASFGWQWIAIACGALGATLTVFGVTGWLAIAWQRSQIPTLSEDKARLQADVAQLQEQADLLAKKGARIKIHHCGKRLCIEASSNQGDRAENWTAPWRTVNGQLLLVIPQGYRY